MRQLNLATALRFFSVIPLAACASVEPVETEAPVSPVGGETAPAGILGASLASSAPAAMSAVCPKDLPIQLERKIKVTGSGQVCAVDNNNLGPISAIWMAEATLNDQVARAITGCEQILGEPIDSNPRTSLPGPGQCWGTASPYEHDIEKTVYCCVTTRYVEWGDYAPQSCPEVNGGGRKPVRVEAIASSCSDAIYKLFLYAEDYKRDEDANCRDTGGTPYRFNEFAPSRCIRHPNGSYEAVKTWESMCCGGRPAPSPYEI